MPSCGPNAGRSVAGRAASAFQGKSVHSAHRWADFVDRSLSLPIPTYLSLSLEVYLTDYTILEGQKKKNLTVLHNDMGR